MRTMRFLLVLLIVLLVSTVYSFQKKNLKSLQAGNNTNVNTSNISANKTVPVNISSVNDTNGNDEGDNDQNGDVQDDGNLMVFWDVPDNQTGWSKNFTPVNGSVLDAGAIIDQDLSKLGNVFVNNSEIYFVKGAIAPNNLTINETILVFTNGSKIGDYYNATESQISIHPEVDLPKHLLLKGSIFYSESVGPAPENIVANDTSIFFRGDAQSGGNFSLYDSDIFFDGYDSLPKFLTLQNTKVHMVDDIEGPFNGTFSKQQMQDLLQNLTNSTNQQPASSSNNVTV